jgi:hypothetical protein
MLFLCLVSLDDTLMDCDIMYVCRLMLMFWRNITPPSSQLKNFVQVDSASDWEDEVGQSYK